MFNKFLRASLAALAVLASTSAENYINPVIPGDYPDPSVIRVGKDYYATATTSEWAPLFPILHSRDLVNWKMIGSVFEKRPEWSVGNYWAPEIYQYKGRFYVYYVARIKGGPLSIAVASADKPEGPYKDHGVMVSQAAGSIDAYPVEDENGTRYLIWKEDGNSRNQPTPLWIQKLSEDGTRLEGEMKEILRNDLPWEGNVVEGPAVIRKDGYYYMLYAANACCGSGCHYGVGVARAKELPGPWEKNPKNPIVTNNAIWKCPGHGTVVDDGKGNYWFLYHAYHGEDGVFVGRQAVLDKIEWESGWPVINGGKGVAYAAEAPFGKSSRHEQYRFADEFSGRELGVDWQWPQHNQPLVTLKRGHLELKASAAAGEHLNSGILAIKTTSGDYTARTIVDRESIAAGGAAGLSAFGDMDNALGVVVQGSQVKLWKKAQRKLEILATKDIVQSKQLHLRMESRNGHLFEFAVSADGKSWEAISADELMNGRQLPPWDRGIRVALTVGGTKEGSARFDSLEIESAPPRLLP